jgi:hypothetical protein
MNKVLKNPGQDGSKTRFGTNIPGLKFSSTVAKDELQIQMIGHILMYISIEVIISQKVNTG